MNESDFEQELRALLPSTPSAGLAERIAHELQNEMPAAVNGALVPVKTTVPAPTAPTAAILPRPRETRALWMWLRALGWTCAGATAAFAILVFTRAPGQRTTATQVPAPAPVEVAAGVPAFEPVDATSELVDAEDQGFVYGEDQTAQRQFRLKYVERHSWTNPATGAVLEFEIPREDIVLMPVAMQ